MGVLPKNQREPHLPLYLKNLVYFLRRLRTFRGDQGWVPQLLSCTRIIDFNPDGSKRKVQLRKKEIKKRKVQDMVVSSSTYMGSVCSDVIFSLLLFQTPYRAKTVQQIRHHKQFLFITSYSCIFCGI